MQRIEKIEGKIRVLGYSSAHNKIMTFFFNECDNVGIVVNSEGIILDANANFLQEIGFTIEEIRNRKFTEFLNPEDVEKTRIAFSQVNEKGEIENFQNQYIKKGGGFVSIKWLKSISVGNDFAVGIGRLV